LNPQNQQQELVRFLLAKEITPMAFTPVARPGGHEKGDSLCPPDWPDLRKDETLKAIAASHNKTVVQIMLNWGLCRGHLVIPKAISPDHQKENTAVFDFKLSEMEMSDIAKLDKGIRLCNIRDWGQITIGYN
jgi:diketogulonate reductase-like aldo/keto reductase